MKSPLYEPLSAQDASYLFFEHRATHMHVAALAIFEVGPLRSGTGGVDAVRLARYGESQLGKLPKYRQKLAFTPLSGRPVWVDDPYFDLDYHLRRTALPAPGSEEELKRLVGLVLSQPLDRNRPLWEMWLIEGLERDRFALLIKVHHCMMDGVSGCEPLDDAVPRRARRLDPGGRCVAAAQGALVAATRARRGDRQGKHADRAGARRTTGSWCP